MVFYRYPHCPRIRAATHVRQRNALDTTNTASGDKLIRLDTFDTAVAVDPSAKDDAKRRFMTLILQTAHRNNGNIGHVLRATNTSGEVFAVKLLKDNAILTPLQSEVGHR